MGKNKNKKAVQEETVAKAEAAVPAGDVADAGPKEVSRDQIKSYLNKCVEMMMSKACRDKLKDASISRPGMNLVEMQREKWDEFKVSRDDGRIALDGIERNFPDDYQELTDLRKKFVETAKATYLQALQDRKPATLAKEGKLPRLVVMEFFDACNLKIDEPDCKEKMKAYCMEHGLLPDPVVQKLHSEVFEMLGYEGEYARAEFEEASKSFGEDEELLAHMKRWQRHCGNSCMDLLREAMVAGVEVKCEDTVKVRLLEQVARQALASMSPEDRGALLDKNGKKVQIFRNLPGDARQKHLENMSDADKIDLMKAELLLMSVQQARQKENQAKQISRKSPDGKFKAGTEFRTLEVIKTVDKNVAAIAKNSVGRVLEVDTDGDLRVSIASKDRPFYHIAKVDMAKLRVTKDGVLRRFDGSASHPAFGSNNVPVHITLTSSETGVWSMLGQSGDMHVKTKDDAILMWDEDTRFEGMRNKDGDYEGSVTQEGNSNGHFIMVGF